MLKISADENITYAAEAFSTLGKVTLLPGREITNTVLKNADVLITRSITTVDKNLLDRTAVRFVGTATIGTDHIDVGYLDRNNIQFADARGCNSDAVAEYVFAALYNEASRRQMNLKELTIGIIGAGNIGSRVARISESIGMKTLLNDPPLKTASGSSRYVELIELMDADIITLHVPMTYEGADKTYHLINEHILNLLKKDCIIINTSRGPVVDTNGLLKFPDLIKVLDVWENEPFVNKHLLKLVSVGTPHIAGYSFEGKVNGTMMIYNSLCSYLGVKPEWVPEYPPLEDPLIKLTNGSDEEIINDLIAKIYDIRRDDSNLRQIEHLDENESGYHFDKLRKEYPLRREFTNYAAGETNRESVRKILTALRIG